jgi:hypothetical protein
MNGRSEGPERFSWRANREGVVTICWSDRPVTILRGRAALRFLARIDGRDDAAGQLEMAKVTGNFKRGNERTPRSHLRNRG